MARAREGFPQRRPVRGDEYQVVPINEADYARLAAHPQFQAASLAGFLRMAKVGSMSLSAGLRISARDLQFVGYTSRASPRA